MESQRESTVKAEARSLTRSGRRDGFDGCNVVAFESRRSREIASLIESYGGQPLVAPSMREIPLDDNPAALEFGDHLLADGFDSVIFTTAVGTRYLMEILETRHSREHLVDALNRATVVARGPKPVKALRELGVTITLTVPEPNTWHDIIDSLASRPAGFSLEGSRIAVQEYGRGNAEFLQALRNLGAKVTPVPVYRWALPEDREPLEAAIRAIAAGTAPVLLFTSGTQIEHVAQVAREMGEWERFCSAAEQGLIASIGPICTDALQEHSLPVHVEPEHPRMGHLVRAASEAARAFLTTEPQRHREGRTPAEERTDASASHPSRPTLSPSGPPGGSVAPASSVSLCLCGEKSAVEQPPWQQSAFMRACRRQTVPYTPIWLMRQAGRYMREYRELREKVAFLDLCKRPDLVSEVTVTAAERIGADAAILFADILLVVEPMGLKLEYTRGEGPVIEPPVRTLADVERLRELEPAALDYVYQGVRQTRADLSAGTPLIGFAGAPFTVASYIIEGGASRSFEHTKGLMYRDPGAWHELMRRISRGLIGYLNGQIEAGAGAVQLFDSWVGCLSPDDYREFVLPHSRSVIQAIRPGTPVIHFGTGTATLLGDMREAGGDVIGLDWRVELDQGWAQIGHDRGAQGNLDPVVLLADQRTIRDRADRILERAAGRPGHIFNLGHGILPQTPVDHVIALVDWVHERSERSHGS